MDLSALPRVLTVPGALTAGFTHAQIRTEIRRGRWRRLATGVLLTRADVPTRHDWLNAGLALGGPGAIASGWDVARLRGLGPQRAPDGSVLVLTPAGRSRLVGGVLLRRSDRPVAAIRTSVLDPTLPDARIAPVHRAVADTALTCRSFDDVRAMVTGAVQRNLCSPADLVGELAAGPRNGSALLRRALDDVAAGAASIAEAEAVAVLRREPRVPSFLVNEPIVDATGAVVCVADLLWSSLRAILEIDSREFHFSEAQWKASMRRHNRLLQLGYSVAHYPPSAFRRHPTRTVDEIIAWLTALRR